MTITETCYSEKDDKTFIMEVTYDLHENPLMERLVGWYYGKPNEDDTRKFKGNLVAHYDGKDVMT